MQKDMTAISNPMSTLTMLRCLLIFQTSGTANKGVTNVPNHRICPSVSMMLID